MITDFSPYLKDGVLNLNQEGNKLSGGKGENECFEDIFDIKQLVKFIQTTLDITEFKATLWGIGKMDINDFRSLMDAIGNSDITALNLEKNTLTSPRMVEKISELTKLTKLSKLNLGDCNIGDEEIIEIVKGLPNLEELNVKNNGITDTGVGAIVEYLPNLLSLNASCNWITDLGADKIKCFKEIEEITIPYGNNISSDGFKGVVEAHRSTLTKVDLFSSAYTSRQLSEIAELLLPNCVVKLGPYWTKGVNHINEAPLPLVGAVWANNNAHPEGDNDAPPLVGVAGDLDGE